MLTSMLLALWATIGFAATITADSTFAWQAKTATVHGQKLLRNFGSLQLYHSNEPHDSHHEHDHSEAAHDEHEHSEPDHEAVMTKIPGTGSRKCGVGAHSIAVGLVFTVVMLPAFMYMVLNQHSDHAKAVSEATLRMLDTFVTIFLAVLWFNFFSSMLTYIKPDLTIQYADVMISIAQVVVLYVIAMAVSYHWRDNDNYLFTFCSCGAHYIAFAGIEVTINCQPLMAQAFEHHILDHPWVGSFVFVIVAFLVMAAASTACLRYWRETERVKNHEKLTEAISDLENDIVGLVLAFAVTQALRHSLTGRYPPHHLLLQTVNPDHGDHGHGAHHDDHGDHGHGAHHDDHFSHTPFQRWFMFWWSVGLTIVAAVFLAHFDLPDMPEWKKKLVHAVKVVLIMCVAWGYLLWGQWQFFELFYNGDFMFGTMVFAVVATMVCLGVLYSLALYEPRSREAHRTKFISITGISLVAAWSWEHCFDLAFDVIGERYQVGYGGLIPKGLLAILIPCVVLPVYISFIKPQVIAMEQKEEETAEEIEDEDNKAAAAGFSKAVSSHP